MGKTHQPERAGVKEIARRANVSIGTVDRVIHNRTGVSEKTRILIQSIIKELDYQPNIMAQRLASKKNLRFTILIPGVSAETEFWKAPLIGIEKAEQELKPYGIHIEKYFFDQNDRKSFVGLTKKILKDGSDGVLLAPSFIGESAEFVTACQVAKIPYVLINSDLPEVDSLSYIGPDLFNSGYLSAHLAGYAIKEGKVLVVNISKDLDNDHHLLRKETGFNTYFKDKGISIKVVRADIRQTDDVFITQQLSAVFAAHPDIQGIFVTNSRVSAVARYLQQAEITDKLLIGFDFLKDNIEQLKKGTIDFLICQKPQEQGYKGIMALYQHLILNEVIEKVHFMPIDIITRENYAVYGN
ncbi:LacI family DNA-binding transcriptional regulator [Pedobacter sp. L105]|uniref:LacI family DNA-binding transcriptional regulator n=1 Tax=Pedobacter sp. L105 TaxID=1641871 RepID=UPI00131D3C36|nr:LacI family DNA-binding transcriptional regulator [Pedobacter sp. L105]